jgi:uncharacterized membrane protein
MTSLVAATAFFLGIHVLISGTRLRDRLVARIGERGFQGVFSLLSLGGLIWLCAAYAGAPYVPLWGPLLGLEPLALVLVLVAFLLIGVGLTTPSPTVVGGESALDADEPARGILRITRHPFLCGVALWAAVHLLVNGDLAGTVLFGGILILALIGPASIDRKRERRLGARWARFAAHTSSVPFAAILQGRNELHIGELGWWRVGVALALYAAFLASHRWLFGVSALPG